MQHNIHLYAVKSAAVVTVLQNWPVSDEYWTILYQSDCMFTILNTSGWL